MMRVTKLRRIKQLLDQIINNKSHYIYIAPLNKEHYERYIAIIQEDYENENFQDVLTNDDVLIKASEKIDVKINILVDTNMYVGNMETNEIGYENELLLFLENNSIDYKFILNDTDLINALENRPNDTVNTTAQCV